MGRLLRTSEVTTGPMDKQFILNLADKLGWPIAAVLIALGLGLTLIVVCRKEFRDLVKRTISISPRSGIKAAAPQPSQVISTNPAAPALASIDLSRQVAANVDPYVLDQRINGICAEFDSRGIGPGQREETLIELLAGALTRETWERTYLLIFGSQIQLLRSMNQSPGGLPEREVRAIYETAVTQQPETYSGVPFESWIGFIETTTLVSRNDENYVLTPYGRGFLKYLIAQGLPFERFG
jgi:hypothetical protein